MVKYLEIILDSYHRTAGSNNNPSWLIPNTFVDSFRVKSAILPNTTQLVDGTNNTIVFTEQATSGTQRTATLNGGNYSLSEMLAHIGSQMTNAGTQTYTATYLPQSSSIRISSAANFRLEGNSSAWYNLGFAKGQQTSFGTTFNAPNPIDLSGFKYLLLTSSTLRSKCIHPKSNNSIVAKIPISAEANSVSYWFNPSEKLFELQSVVTEVSLTLVNPISLQPIDMKDKSWSITLEVESI